MEGKDASGAGSKVKFAMPEISGIIAITFGFFQSVVIGLYALLFGILLILWELKDNYNVPFIEGKALSFLDSLFGRGFFYIFWGFQSLNVNTFTFQTFVGIMLMLGGLLYIFAHFIFPDLTVPPVPETPEFKSRSVVIEHAPSITSVTTPPLPSANPYRL